MLQDTLLPFSFPAVGRKKVSAAFDGGRMTSDGGVMLLGAVERRIGRARMADVLRVSAALAQDPASIKLCQENETNPSATLVGPDVMRLAYGQLPAPPLPAYLSRSYKVIPKPQPLASAEFTTLRMRLLKIAARITETATRVRIAFAAACPDAQLFASLARYLRPAEP